MAKECKAYSFSNISSAEMSLGLLLLAFQLLLNTVKKGVRYISHILSKNKIEEGDLEVMMSMSVSWTRDSSSAGKRSQHRSVDDTVDVTRSVSSYLNGFGAITYSRGNKSFG